MIKTNTVPQRPWRTLLVGTCLAALALPAQAQEAPSFPVAAQDTLSGFSLPAAPVAVTPAKLQPDLVQTSDPDLYGFYHERGYYSLWLGADGALRPAARTMIGYFETADIDGLQIDTSGLRAALAQVEQGATPASLTNAELMISRIFGAYALALRDTTGSKMYYEHWNLRPEAKRPYFLLQDAGMAASLDEWVQTMGWMHPMYAQIREQLVASQVVGTARLAGVKSLERLRSIPPAERHVLVDAGSATLWMYEGGRVVDSMKVVVGTAETPSPLQAGFMRFAIFNPYWNVPDTLVTKTIAKNVLSRGAGYLKTAGYQVLSDWTDAATVIDPTTVDWKKAALGEHDLRVRQKPRFDNAMGTVKFEFPNPMGIYIHDTPTKQYFRLKDRHKSNGCIRLEDSDRFGRWLFNGNVPEVSDDPEQRFDLPALVPVYVTYLTVKPEEGQLALLPDYYGMDAAAVPVLVHETAPAPTTASTLATTAASIELN